MSEIFDDLFLWISDFKTETVISIPQCFVGRCIAEILYQIDTSVFNEEWLETIVAHEIDANWRLKALNLRKIYRKLQDYYADFIGVDRNTLSLHWNIDTSKMASDSDQNSLSLLLQLVLASAFFSPRNKEFVNLLQKQAESVQNMVMSLVADVNKMRQETTETSYEKSSSTQQEEFEQEKIETILQETKDMARKFNNQQTELNELKSEKQLLIRENESLKVRLDELSDSGNEADCLKRLVSSLRTQKEEAFDSLYKTEAEKVHFKEKSEQLQCEVDELKKKLLLYSSFETENRQLKDKLEEVQQSTESNKNLLLQVDRLKMKLKEKSSQRSEVNVLEEKLSLYMKSAIAYEDEQRKNAALRTQIEALVLQKTDMDNQLLEEMRRADKEKFEREQLSKRLEEVTRERDRLRQECRQLDEKLLYGESMGSTASLHDETVAAEKNSIFRNRLKALEDENEFLRQSGNDSSALKEFEEKMRDLASEKTNLETELRIYHFKNAELQKKLNELNENISSADAASGNRWITQQEDNEKLKLEIAQLEAKLSQYRIDLEATNGTKEKLHEHIKSLTKEKSHLESYIEKARRVITDLDGQNRAVEGGALSRHEFDSIRKERDSFKHNYELLKENSERSLAMQEEEQRLITGHAYSMMLKRHHVQQLKTEQNHRDARSEKTFLTRQRLCNTLGTPRI